MSAVLWFMYVNPTDNCIHAVNQANEFPNLEGGVVRQATFSTDDQLDPPPDVLKEKPLVGSQIDAALVYTEKVELCLKIVSWTGDGLSDPNDNVYEMAANSSNQATLRVQKWDAISDQAVQESGDKFGLSIVGGSINCPCGVVTLDSEGKADILFQPDSNEKGDLEIELRPINVSYRVEKTRVRFV